MLVQRPDSREANETWANRGTEDWPKQAQRKQNEQSTHTKRPTVTTRVANVRTILKKRK